jgi:hypothetical protein
MASRRAGGDEIDWRFDPDPRQTVEMLAFRHAMIVGRDLRIPPSGKKERRGRRPRPTGAERKHDLTSRG